MKRKEFERLLERVVGAPTLEALNSIEFPNDLSTEQRQLAMDTGHSVAMALSHRPTPINPKEALYIKLGERGKWERLCLEEDQTLRIGWEEIDHELCLQGRWDEVLEQLLPIAGTPGAAADWRRQLRHFYEAADDVLWITFDPHHLWWCFSKPDITLLEGGSRVRPATTKCRNRDIKGQPLSVDRLSGALVAVQGYRGTISKIGQIQLPYLVRKINATLHPLAHQAKSSRNSLVHEIGALVGHLHWRDFELLVELLFGKIGWERVSSIGGSQKDLDIIFIAPVTGAKYGVQVKSTAQLPTFRQWESHVTGVDGFDRFYFAVHSPSNDLVEAKTFENVQILGPREIAEWSVKYGFVDWIINRAG